MKTLKELKKGSSKGSKINKILFFIIVIVTVTFSMGYSLLNENLYISGEAVYRVKEDIRITDVSLSSTSNNGLEAYRSSYAKDTVNTFIDLNNESSTVTYKVAVANTGTVAYLVSNITLSNENVSYYLSEGYDVREIINPGDIVEYYVTLKAAENVELPMEEINVVIKFDFEVVSSILYSDIDAKKVINESLTIDINTLKTFNGPLLRTEVESIKFIPTLKYDGEYIGSWDASYSGNGTVVGWYLDNDSDGLYEVIIGGIGEVQAPENSSGLFMYFTKLTSIDFGEYFNTENVTDMSFMFYLNSLTSLDVSNFNTSKVTDMAGMFMYNMNLTNLDVSNFDTSKVTDMSNMFFLCDNLASLELSNFNTSSVTNMSYMFAFDGNLTNLDLSNFNTSKVTDMSYMFTASDNLINLDVSNFNTTNVTNMSYMFDSTKSLTSLDLRNFDTSNVTDMYRMFENCSSLTSLDLSNFNTSNVTYMGRMFENCSSLTSLDLSNFNTSNVTSMYNMFSNANIETLNLNNGNFNNKYNHVFELPSTVKNLYMKNVDISTYKGITLTGLTNLEYVDMTGFIANADMSSFFQNCTKLSKIVFDNIDTSKVVNMNYMFFSCNSLTNLDLSSFNTSSVKTMNYTFYDCSSLTGLDLSSFNTSSVTSMGFMFYGCKNLISLDVSNFDTSNVADMSRMFQGCNSLTKLDLSSFNTSKVTDMGNMFYGCSNLKNLNLSSFTNPMMVASEDSIPTMTNAFYACSSLETLDMRNWNFLSEVGDAIDITGLPTSMTIYVGTGQKNIFETFIAGGKFNLVEV